MSEHEGWTDGSNAAYAAAIREGDNDPVADPLETTDEHWCAEAFPDADNPSIEHYVCSCGLPWITGEGCVVAAAREAGDEKYRTLQAQIEAVLERYPITSQTQLADDLRAINPDGSQALADLIAEAEQRGREDNTGHGMCYVYGSKALGGRLADVWTEGWNAGQADAVAPQDGSEWSTNPYRAGSGPVAGDEFTITFGEDE